MVSSDSEVELSMPRAALKPVLRSGENSAKADSAESSAPRNTIVDADRLRAPSSDCGTGCPVAASIDRAIARSERGHRQ